MRSGIFQERGDRQVRFVIGGRIHLRHHGGVAHRHRPAGGDSHLAKQAHVLVRRRGVPIHKGDRQVGIGGGEDFHGQHVRLTRESVIGDVELVGPPRSGCIVALGQLLAVQPDVGAVVDTSEIQPDTLSLEARGQYKLLAIPPRNDEGTVRLHGDIGKVQADRVGNTRQGAQIRPEKRIGIHLLLDQCGDYRGGHGYVIPIPGLERGGGNNLAFRFHLAG